MDSKAISYSYMVTNREHPHEESYDYIKPLSPSWNFYFSAPGANNPNSQAYSAADPVVSMPSSYREQLEIDIVNAVQNGGRDVTVFIHGMSYLFSDACYTLGTFGQNLAAQGYKGLLIGFSWPSYGSVESVHYYARLPYSFPPTAKCGYIRDNIHGSTKSLLNLLSQLVPLCKKHGTRLNLVCHSEGNYMLMLAMYALSSNSDPALSELLGEIRFIDQVLMVAADINNGALEPPQGSTPVAGQGSWIAQHSKTVTVYWSSKDTLLPQSDGWTAYHNPSFPLRLGLHGLASYARGGQKRVRSLLIET